MRRAGLLLLVVAACGDNLPGIELSELEASRRAAECERYVRCDLFGAEDVCTALFRETYDPALTAMVDAGKLSYDPIAAAACNEALAARSCDTTAADARALPAVCSRVLIGTIAAGATCADDRECGTGRCDAPRCILNACCTGGCAAYVAPAKIDEACVPDTGCIEGAFCGADMHCHALGAMSAACDQDLHCAVGLACIGATELQAGACRPLPKLGEPCPYLRCAEIGARCDGVTCVPVGITGAPCANDTECSEFHRCEPTTQRCVDLPTLGQPCYGRCAGEAWCDTSTSNVGTCRTPQPNAVPCTASDQCASQYCEEGPIFDACAEPALCF